MSTGTGVVKPNDTADSVPAKGLATVKLVLLRVATGTAVDEAMAAAAMFVAFASVTAAVSEASSAVVALVGVVTPSAPDGIVTVHVDPAASIAVFAVRISAAVPPDPVADGTTVVVPHPLEYVGVMLVKSPKA